MSASTALPLRYVLPATALTLSVTLRLVVVVDDQGGHLEPEVSAMLSAPWHPSPLSSVRRVVTHDSHSLSGSMPAAAVPGSLRRVFDRAHPRTAALIADLSARSEQYLAGLRMGEESAQVVTFGQALEVVHRELAAADRARREWISRQGRDLRSAEWDLTTADMVSVSSARATLAGSIDVPSGRAQELAREFGLLLALVSDDAEAGGTRGRNDTASIAVYRRRPERWPDSTSQESDQDWVRDDTLSRLRFADADSGSDIPQQRVSTEAERNGAPLLRRPTTADPELEAATRAARIQLELLDASDEYSRLASTQYRAEEIAALQHQMQLNYLPRQRSSD
jgi:hypothetical protein